MSDRSEKAPFTADAGFSLIEMLVAVVILALAAVTLLEHQSQAMNLTVEVERRALASIVAENRMAQALGRREPPVSGTLGGEETQMGVAFRWRQTVRPAAGTELMLVQVSVYSADGAHELAALTGFRRAG